MNEGEEAEFVLNNNDFTAIDPSGVTDPLAFAGRFTHIFEGFDLERERRFWSS